MSPNDVAAASWPGPLVWYAYLSGVAAGGSVVGAAASVFGGESERQVVRFVPLMAAGLVAGCAALIGSDGRAWEALGSGARTGLVALGVSSVATAFVVRVKESTAGPEGAARGSANRYRSAGGKVLATLVAVAAVGLAASPGPVSQPAGPDWAGPVVLGAVGLATAATTGCASVVLLALGCGADPSDKAVDRVVLGMQAAVVVELAALTAFALSLRGPAGSAFQRWPGELIPLFVVPVGLLGPLFWRQTRGPRGAADAAGLVLLGGFVLRAALAGMPGALRNP